MRKLSEGTRLKAEGGRRAVNGFAAIRNPQSAIRNPRRGTVLIVVVALLGALALLGFFFYTFAQQERITAQFFAEAAKAPEEDRIDVDALMDHGLRHLIVGPDNDEGQSVLWGGRHSLLPTMFGSDIHPYTGEGVHVINTASGSNVVSAVDQDYNGTPDDGSPMGDPDRSYLLDWNDSPAAQGSAGDRVVNLRVSGMADPDASVRYPEPDADYTYPDINSPFLTYRSLDGSGAEVITPAFHRPQYVDNFASRSDWYTAPQTRARMLRPHKEHLAVVDGYVTGVPRYVRDQQEVQQIANQTGVRLGGPFPFDPGDPPDNNNNPDNSLKQGVWSNDSNNYEGLDADADGDGIKEAVYLDLGFPIQELPDGSKKFVPMWAFTVVDADALFNLNAHGNTNADFANFPNGGFLSASNEGLQPSEVNPQWGLDADPPPSANGDPFLQHNYYLQRNPNDPNVNVPSQIELSNLEWLWLVTGRPEFEGGNNASDITDLFAGRRGEEGRLRNVISTRNPRDFPWTGATSADDNGNGQEGGRINVGSYPQFSSISPIPAPVHPFDLRGRGTYVESDGLTRKLYSPGASPVQWPAYEDYYVSSVNSGNHDVYRDARYANNLLPGRTNRFRSWLPANAVRDDESETIVEPDEASDDGSDTIFGADENAALQLSDTDLAATGTTGRALSLAPYNFRDGPGAEDRRRKYTSTSWDLKSFGKTRYLLSSENTLRSWEFTDVDNDGEGDRFPANFTGGGTHPFRGELRQLLQINLNNTTRKPQRKLSLNGVLDRNPQTQRLRFRPLTPHPTSGLGNSAITPAGDAATRPQDVSNPRQQEYLARLDRQRMARDIYVLLYTLGGPEGAYTGGMTNSMYADGYTDAEARRMAQFAVNVVDALDPDNVTTRFLYDKDLSNGWSPNDSNPNNFDPFYKDVDGANGINNDNDDEFAVDGVERQELTISESLVIRTAQVFQDPMQQTTPADHDATEYDDTSQHRFAYVELRNAGPFDVEFNGSSQDAQWELGVSFGGNPGNNPDHRLRVLDDGGWNPTISAGELFTIGTADDDTVVETQPNMPGEPYSMFKVDPQWTQGAPQPQFWDQQSGTWIVQTDGLPDLDLIRDHPSRVSQPRFEIDDQANAQAGAFFNGIGSSNQVTFILYRRLNPHRGDTSDNPMIEVDRMQVDVQEMRLEDPDDEPIESGDMNDLNDLQSTERLQPFTRSTQGQRLHARGARANTVGRDNDRSPATFQVWQPHFDREFTSVAELFNVPLLGPDELTTMAPQGAMDDNETVNNTAGSLFTDPGQAISGAGGPPGGGPPGGGPPGGGPPGGGPPGLGGGNRWYRLLEFVEVPSRLHRHESLNNSEPWFVTDAGRAGGALRFFRDPGRINVNTMRHADVFAGLLDEPDHYQSGWWSDFLDERDGDAGLDRPGIPGRAEPFRSLDFAALGESSPDHTLLRTSGGQPFIGIPGSGGDYTTQYRLLQKVLNNSTTRSNVFLVFIQVDFFEAVEVNAGDVDNDGQAETVTRIGAKLPNSPGHRGFFVIDRAQALEQIDPENLPRQEPGRDGMLGTPDDGAFTFTMDHGDIDGDGDSESFDFNEVIQYRRILE